VAAALAGTAVAMLGGVIGLGGAEFRLPILIGAFALYAHRAIRINLLITLATLGHISFVAIGLRAHLSRGQLRRNWWLTDRRHHRRMGRRGPAVTHSQGADDDRDLGPASTHTST
jgi:hypothetical protein